MRFIANCVALFLAGVSLGLLFYEWQTLSEVRRVLHALLVISLTVLAGWNLRQFAREARTGLNVGASAV